MANSKLLVDFWEVGQGDCTVIQLPSGEIILIDVGPIGSPLVDWLFRQPQRYIHSIVITHNDGDHAGAITSVVACCRGRIGTVYVMVDRKIKDPRFLNLFRKLNEIWRAGEIKHLCRLEAPKTLWLDPNSTLRLDVRHPTMASNVFSSSPNETSAVIVLSSPTSETLLWAGDTTMQNIAAVATGTEPSYMLGPHHGAPTDRRHDDFPLWLRSIKPHRVIASVGSKNRYNHPCCSYIKHAKRAGADFRCTQLTKLCEKPGRLHHVFKAAALYGLPQVSTGYSCRGTIRLIFDGRQFIQDSYAERQHADGIKKLTRPKCL